MARNVCLRVTVAEVHDGRSAGQAFGGAETTTSLLPSEDEFLRSTVELGIIFKMFGWILVGFLGFQAILLVLVVWARFLKLE